MSTRASVQRTRPARPALVRLVLPALGWAMVAVLGLCALLRLVAWDSLEPLVVINALSVLVYAPAWIIGIVAMATGRWALGAAAAVLVAAQLAFLAPEFLASAPVPAWASHATTITVLDANIDKAHSFEAGYAKAVARMRPDVIALEEIRPHAYLEMVTSGILTKYPHLCAAPAPGPSGFLLAAKWPLRGCSLRKMRDHGHGYARPYMVEATLQTPAGPVALRVVHTLAPLPVSWMQTAAELAGVAAAVHATGTKRMLMMGDFNATWNNKGFVAIMNVGLTDGAAARGDALDMTWPNGALIPPVVRIDHILTGRDLTVTSIQSRAGFGSDHRFLTATVAVRATQ